MRIKIPVSQWFRVSRSANQNSSKSVVQSVSECESKFQKVSGSECLRVRIKIPVSQWFRVSRSANQNSSKSVVQSVLECESKFQ